MLFGGPEAIRIRRADGSGEPRTLLEKPGVAVPNFSRDGSWVAFYVVDPETGRDLWALSMDNPEEPTVVLRTSANEARPVISPDGGFLAYQSDSSGRWEIYVQPFPAGEGRWQVSVDGGQHPSWRPDGGELYYVADDALMVVTIATEPSVQIGPPHRLFTGRDIGTRLSLPRHVEGFYNPAPDGARFAVVHGVGQGTSDIVLATGELEALDETEQ